MEVVVTDRDRPEGNAKKGGGSSDGNGVRVGVRGQAGRDRGRRGQGGVPGSERVQWSGVDRGGGLLNLNLQRATINGGYRVEFYNLKRDRV